MIILRVYIIYYKLQYTNTYIDIQNERLGLTHIMIIIIQLLL